MTELLPQNLVSGNISSEVRQKIGGIGAGMHPKARAVAKAVCLLQFERRIPRTAENIAATLHPAVEADSHLADVKAALDALVAAQAVRLGEDGYRIPTPAEDDWEKQRAELRPKQADTARIHSEVVAGLWAPTPSHTLLGGQAVQGRPHLQQELGVRGRRPGACDAGRRRR